MAESFGTDAERYDATRPAYPAALVERLVAACPGQPSPRVLDVGCGTGIAARQFRAAGCRVLGVEPDGRMAEVARRGPAGIDVEVATFEGWDPAGRVFDAVVAAQAWHWVDPVAGAAKAAGVLRPDGGRLAAFWHVPDTPRELSEALVAALRRVAPDTPFDLGAMTRREAEPYRVMLDRTAEGIRAADAGFGEPEEWRFGWERSFTREEYLDQLATFGPFTRLGPEGLAVVRDSVGAVLDATGRGEGFTIPYDTVLLTVRRER